MTEDLQSSRRLISICVPVFNEEENIEPFCARISNVLAGLADHYDFEIVFTDNHSEDATFEKLLALSDRDHRVRIIRFSRNFGFQRSILTAYNNCRGEAAIQLDVDLQDPPELIVEFLRHWRLGYQVVYGVRRSRSDEGWLLVTARKLFYRLIDFLSDDQLPHDAGDFRLVDRCILEQLRSVSDQQPYLRGMIAAMGFKQTGIAYDRASRERGRSHFSFVRLLSLAFDGILHHSLVPLRLAMVLGLAMSFLAVLGTLYFVVVKLFFRTDWPIGLPTIAVLILFSIGMNAVLLGIVGEYIGRIYKNVKHAPLTITEAIVDRHASPAPARAEAEKAGGPIVPANSADARRAETLAR